ncbi:MAG: hypothetical protein JWM51_296 [Microbacteriaceae bacterium]|jgi:hypothetical protein|nr:hypothetical protein [Microbacteriaceae bacterium]
MSNTSQLTITFDVEIPAGWHKLPAPGRAEDTDAAVRAIVDGLDIVGDTRHSLLHVLAAVTAVAQAPKRGGRMHWALVPEPGNGRVEALMSLGTIANAPGRFEEYKNAAAVDLDEPDADADNPAELINRTVSERTLRVGRAVAVHDFVIEPTTGGVADPAVERAIVALFPERAGRGIEMSIVTQNLAWFDDVTGYLVDIASTFRETEVRSA